jgi:hypothetical protein
MTRFNRIWTVLLLVCLATTGSLSAQVIQEQLRRIEAEKARDPLYSQWTAREQGEKTFTWGGWSSFSALSFDNDDNSEVTPDALRSMLILDQRVWGKVEFKDGSSFYGRVRWLDFDFDMAPGLAEPKLSNEGVDLDLAYYDFELGDGYNFRLGRQYIRQGSGLTMNGNYDGVKVDWSRRNWSFSSFFVKNTPNDPDLDIRVDHPRRFFRAFNVDYLAETGERYFAYYLGENDDSPQPGGVAAATQTFDLDASFWAIGSSGDFTQELSYYGEAILQRGEQMVLGSTTRRAQLDARAATTELIYHPKWKGHPTFSAEYSLASGDANRVPGIWSLSGGNSVDRNFYGFGRYDGGLALNPRLSNLRVFRAGFTWKPWEDERHFENLVLGSKLSRFTKADRLGGISDLEATSPSADVGNSFDLFLGWRPWSDLSILAQWGRFTPGDAYPVTAQDSTKNLFVNVTYSF